MSTETRSERINVSLTPSMLARLENYAAQHRWKVGFAAAVLIEEGLAADDGQDQEARSR